MSIYRDTKFLSPTRKRLSFAALIHRGASSGAEKGTAAKTRKSPATRPLGRIFIFANSGFNFRTLFHGFKDKHPCPSLKSFHKEYPSFQPIQEHLLSPPCLFRFFVRVLPPFRVSLLSSILAIASAYLRFFFFLSHPPRVSSFCTFTNVRNEERESRCFRVFPLEGLRIEFEHPRQTCVQIFEIVRLFNILGYSNFAEKAAKRSLNFLKRKITLFSIIERRTKMTFHRFLVFASPGKKNTRVKGLKRMERSRACSKVDGDYRISKRGRTLDPTRAVSGRNRTTVALENFRHSRPPLASSSPRGAESALGFYSALGFSLVAAEHPPLSLSLSLKELDNCPGIMRPDGR